MQTSRRDFIRSASVATGASLFSFTPPRITGKSTKTGLCQRQIATWSDWVQGHGVV